MKQGQGFFKWFAWVASHSRKPKVANGLLLSLAGKPFYKVFVRKTSGKSGKKFLIFLFLTRVLLFLVNCLSCYTCTSEDSLETCNSKLTKNDCPSGTPNYVTGTLTCSAADVTKTVFYKRCGTKGKTCDPSDYPSCASSQGGWTYSFANKCYPGDNCNAPPNTVNSGPLYRINGALTGISIFLAFLGFSYF